MRPGDDTRLASLTCESRSSLAARCVSFYQIVCLCLSLTWSARAERARARRHGTASNDGSRLRPTQLAAARPIAGVGAAAPPRRDRAAAASCAALRRSVRRHRSVETKACVAWVPALAQAADWPRLAEAPGILRHALALRAASGAPASWPKAESVALFSLQATPCRRPRSRP